MESDLKLTVISGIEPGCLGPQGKDHIEEFCRFAQAQTSSENFPFIHWHIKPHYDKTADETQYRISDKTLSRDKANKYFAIYNTNADDFEELLDDKIVCLIELYHGL